MANPAIAAAVHAFLGQIALGHDKYNRDPGYRADVDARMEEAVKALKTSWPFIEPQADTRAMAHRYWTAIPGKSAWGADDPYQHEAVAGISAAINALKRFTRASFAEVFEGVVHRPIGPTIKIGR
ncbi:hypothetical protein P9A16_11485 [Shinella sp. 838]|uniref:hypothetical protein n=1 Tax=Shinella sp. 838 TaxID=3038164 RepID=UPI002414F6AB|nr:hypothetical protein [Shinella sp. 838]MDG4671746.1 hypothetical protein [Shinella sp. 838]